MIRARFGPKAARDLDEISGHIAADNPEAAERVRRVILNMLIFLRSILKLGGASARRRHAICGSAGSSCRSSTIT